MKGSVFGLGIAGSLLLIGGGLAVADPVGGAINACVNNRDGLTRITDEQCRAAEHSVSWNEQGVPGVSGYEIVTQDRLTEGSVFASTTAACPPGKKALGGGIIALGTLGIGGSGELSEVTTTALGIYSSKPTADGSGWLVGYDAAASLEGIRVYATCATVT